MGFTLQDPSSGLGANVAKSQSGDGRLRTDARTNLRGYYASRDAGLCFNAVAIDAGAAAGDYVFYLKNTSTTRNLVVDLIRVGAVNAARWKIATVTGTASGTAITPVNLNLSSGKTAEVTCIGGTAAISGLTEDAVFAVTRNAAAASTDIPFDDTLILGPGNAFAAEYDTGTTGIAELLVRFYFEDL